MHVAQGAWKFLEGEALLFGCEETVREELERPAGHCAVKRNVEAEDQQRGASAHMS